MRKLLISLIFVLVVGISGCSWLCKIGIDSACDDTKPTPTPKPTPTMIAIGNPAIVNRELKIDNKKAVGFGAYTLLVDANKYPDSSIEPFFKEWSEVGCNFMRIWVKTYFRPTDWQPWDSPTGKFDLSKPNPHFYNRMELIADMADKYGVCIAWTLIDFWSVRQGFGYPISNTPDSLCPSRHIDPYTSQGYNPMMTLNGYYDEWGGQYMNGSPRARRIYKCKYNVDDDPNSGCSNLELGCRKHPAWKTLFEKVATLAKAHNDIVYIASEMVSGDVPHDEWDKNAMIEFTEYTKNIIRGIYPNSIIGTSVEDKQAEVYQHVQIADIHALGYGKTCCPVDIPNSNTEFRKINTNAVVCFNSDGCMNGCGGTSRYDINYMTTAIRNAWSVGGFFETKGLDDSALPNIKEAFRQVKAER